MFTFDRKPRPSAARNSGSTGEVVPAIVSDVLRTGGSPLDASVRAHFEPRFAQDFSGVRVHTSAPADDSAREMNARAYTVGPHLVFQRGAFAPDTNDGRRLLAHELTHVVQQRKGGSSPSDRADLASMGQPGDRAEQEAEQAAGTGIGVRAPIAVPGPVLQRKGAADAADKAKPDPTEKPAGTLWAQDAKGKDLPPSLDDIAQGGLNDCFLFAAMAAMVNTNPQQIVDMIHDNGDGTYTVSFKGISGLAGKQKVSADFVVGKHGRVTAHKALWPLIVEKAYTQEKGGIKVVDKEGGNAGTAIKEMTKAGPSRFDPRDKTTDYILGKLTQAKEKKWPATIHSPKQDVATKDKKAIADGMKGLHFWHAYAIIDIDPKTNRIKLFNPWGYDHPNRDGWIEIEKVRVFFIEIEIGD